MFQAFYTGLSGMNAFSRNLDTVSNNIANMNTPGYRGADSFYQSLTYGDSLNNGGGGFGTQISGLGYRFSSGDIRQTGNATDLAIAGQGMFVLKNDDQLLYTRAGQFAFNDDGILIDKVTGFEVASIDDNGQITSLNISNYKTLAPEATTSIDLSGSLSTDDNEHIIDGLKVYNGLGEEVTVNIKFTNNSATLVGSWNVEVTDVDGTVLSTGEVRFAADGTPLTGFNKHAFTISDSHGGNTNISFNLGDPASFSGATSTSTGATSSLGSKLINGHGMATLTSINFNADGSLKLAYSNGEEAEGPSIAMAHFSNNTALKLFQGSVFSADDVSSRTIGKAGEGAIGQIVAESIELSNVDLSKEFADMIIIQRGYQASSRILNVANEMLEQLYDSTRG